MSGLDVLAGRARWAIDRGDVLECLAALPDGSVNCVVTSPPYWGLRDYGVAGQIGLEPTPDAYVARMVAVFAEVRRVLRSDGTCWVNLGDSYSGAPVGSFNGGGAILKGRNLAGHATSGSVDKSKIPGLKPKDLVGIPWRVAFALQADGWWLRSDVVWAKPNPMPESVTDRPTRSHEYLFLLTKSAKYAYDADAIREPLETAPHAPGNTAADRWREVRGASVSKGMSGHLAEPDRTWGTAAGRNKRTVWTIATEPYPDAHFAVFPTALVEPCVLAGCPAKTCPLCGAPYERVVERGPSRFDERRARGEPVRHGLDGAAASGASNVGAYAVASQALGWEPSCDCGNCPERKDGRHEWIDGADICARCGCDWEHRLPELVPGVVLDPFAGSGTTLLVALRHGRRGIGIELNPKYVEMASRRIVLDCPMFNAEDAS